jgi:hypothetical protein
MGEIGAAWARCSLAASRIALNPQPLHLLFLCGQHRGRRPGAGGDKPTRLTTSSRVNGVGTIIELRLEHRTQAEPDATSPAGRDPYNSCPGMAAEAGNFCPGTVDASGGTRRVRDALLSSARSRFGFLPDFLTRRVGQSLDRFLGGLVDSAIPKVGHGFGVATARVTPARVTA